MSFNASFATEMAADLRMLREESFGSNELRIVRVEDQETLRKWIHIASIGFRVPAEFEDSWYEFFAEAACASPFRTYLALLNGKPVATSQLFTSAGVAGIYNVTCLPKARGRGVGTAVVLAPLLKRGRWDIKWVFCRLLPWATMFIVVLDSRTLVN